MIDNEKLRRAALTIYLAGRWICPKIGHSAQVKMWEALREALGIEPQEAIKRGVDPLPNVETGWVIEAGSSDPSAPLYWVGVRMWSPNHLDAVRFTRKKDAERVLRSIEAIEGPRGHRICMHEWS